MVPAPIVILDARPNGEVIISAALCYRDRASTLTSKSLLDNATSGSSIGHSWGRATQCRDSSLVGAHICGRTIPDQGCRFLCVTLCLSTQKAQVPEGFALVRRSQGHGSAYESVWESDGTRSRAFALAAASKNLCELLSGGGLTRNPRNVRTLSWRSPELCHVSEPQFHDGD